MNRWIATLTALLAPAAPAVARDATPSPYAHQGSSEVKTLSQQEVDDLLTGAGMGLARPAELNGYPGPRHVLDLADSLGLTAEQRAAVERIHADMKERAVALGRQRIAAEQALDATFASNAATEDAIAAAVTRIGRLEAELRAVHLLAHLATRAALTPAQIHEYGRLRGYGDAHEHPEGGS